MGNDLKLVAAKGSDGDPKRDENGHGTLVASFIGGPYGVAGQIPITPYMSG